MNDSSADIVAEAAARSHPEGPLPLSQLLAQIVQDHAEDRLTLAQLASQLRDRAWGGLLLMFAAINVLPLPPGATTITGIPLLILTAQMAAGRASPWFPKKIDRRGLTKDEVGRLIAKMVPLEERIERVLKPRLCALTNHRAARVIGVVSFILSVVLWLPIPLGNHAPAVSMSLFALALIYRDGILAILGAIATVVSIALLGLTFTAAWLAVTTAIHAIFG